MVEGRVMCPYCGEAIDMEVEESGDPDQEYVEDCQVCRQVMAVRIATDEEGEPTVVVGRLGTIAE